MKVSSEDSDGTLAFFHLVAPPMSGPPRHVHSREDELFYVLEGDLVVELDGERHTVRAATPPGALPAFDVIAAIATRYGITTLGPPMFQ